MGCKKGNIPHNKGKSKENYEPMRKTSESIKKLYKEGRLNTSSENNGFFGKHHTKEEKERIVESIKGKNKGEKNGMWKGDNVGYASLHEWVRNNKPKPNLCEKCNKNGPYEVSNISGEYKRDINDFEWLCRSCHKTKHDKERLK